MKKTNARFHKFVCMILTLAVGMSIGRAAMFSGVFAEGTDEAEQERLMYQSSDNYAISSDGTWDGGIWSAQVYDLEKNAYSRMTDASSGAKWGVNYGTDDGDYYRLAVTNPDNYQRIGAYWMTPAARTKADGSHKNPAVKTFTAPKSGTVTIACGDNKFGPKDGMQSNTRIRLESGDGTLSTVWPSDAEYFTMPKDSTANVPYDPFSISLKQGEKLHFEVSRNVEKLDTDSVWARIYWDPVVTYQSIDPDTPDEPDDQIRYQASEAFRAASNSDRHWSCLLYTSDAADE